MKTYQWFADAINLILLYIVIRSIDGLVTISMGFDILPCDGIGITLIVAYMYFLRVYITRLKVYQFLSAIPALVLYKIDFGMFMTKHMDVLAAEQLPALIKVKMFIILICMWGLNAYYWSHDDAEEATSINIVFIIAVIIAYVTVITKGANSEGRVIFIYGIIFIALSEVRMYLENLINFGELEQLNKDMPVKEMYVRNSLMALPSIVIGVLFMIFISLNGLEELIAKLTYKIEYFFAWLLSKGVSTEATEEVISKEETFLEFPVIEDGGMFPAWVGHLISALAFILLVAGIVFVLYLITSGVIRFLTKDEVRAKRKKANFFVPDGASEIRESLSGISGRRHGFGKNATDEDRFRLLYKKRILAVKKKGVSVTNTYTPVEIKENALKEKDIDIREATELYESKRYNAGYTINKEDVSLMKKAVKG